jgi:hypothetical protein
MAASFDLTGLRWAWAGLARLARDSRLRVVPGRLLGVVAAPPATAGSPPSIPLMMDRGRTVRNPAAPR